MLPAASQRIRTSLPDTALVLDVGGWAVPFTRADWVLDLGAYETRGAWGYDGPPADERFSADTWVERDVCDREPWPFPDDRFDFAVCSHTLEDLRDPVWVCRELARVAKAGYVEVPSRLEEQTWGFQGPWAGWSHHHWLIEVDEAAAAIDFVFKHHNVHAPAHRFPTAFRDTLSAQERVSALWWEGGFSARERMFDVPAQLDAYLRELVLAHGRADDAPAPDRRRRLRRPRPRR